MIGPDNYEIGKLVQRFEEMKKHQKAEFFDVEELELIADYYFFAGNAGAAIDVMDFGSHQHPYTSIFPLKKSQFLIDENRLEEVRSELKKVESLDPNNPELFITHADLLSRSGQHEKAIIQLKKALRLDEEDIEVLMMIAQEYQELNDYQKSKFYLLKVLEKDSDEVSALYSLIHCFDLLQENEKAIKYLDSFINKNPYSEIAWHHLGLQYAQVNNLEKSLWAFDYAILCDEYFTAAYYEKGRVLEDFGNFQAAAEVYKQVLDFEEFSSYAYMRIGLVYRLMKEYTMAEKFLKKAFKDDPYLEEAILNLVTLYDDLGDYGKAIFYVRKLLKLDTSPQYVLFASDVMRKAGQSDKSLIMLNELLCKGENEAEIFIQYVEILMDQLRVELAFEMIEQGLENHPLHPGILFRKALICNVLGDVKQGLSCFELGLMNNDLIELKEFLNKFPGFKKLAEVENLLKKFGYMDNDNILLL